MIYITTKILQLNKKKKKSKIPKVLLQSKFVEATRHAPMLKFHKLFNIQNKILIFYNDEIILKKYNNKKIKNMRKRSR